MLSGASLSEWTRAVCVCVCVCVFKAQFSATLWNVARPVSLFLSPSLSLLNPHSASKSKASDLSRCVSYPEENRRFPSQLGWRRAWKCWPVSILTPYMVIQRLGMKEAAAARSKAATAPPTDPTSACFIKICLLLQTYSHASRRNTSQCFSSPSCFLIRWRRAPLICLVLYVWISRADFVAAYINTLFIVRIS